MPKPGPSSGDTRLTSAARRPAAVLRTGQPRRRLRRGQGLRGAARRQAGGARRENGPDGLERAGRRPAGRLLRDDGAAVLERHGLRRHLGRRVRDPWPRHGLRCQLRPAGVALQHHPRPGRIRQRLLACRQRYLEIRRRLHVADAGARSRSRAAVHHRRQPEPGPGRQRPRRRQPVHRIHRRAGRQDRVPASGTSRKSTTISGTTTSSARTCCSTSR